MRKTGKIQVYKDTKGEFRWRITAPNGKKIANSGEGYKNHSDCLDGLELVFVALTDGSDWDWDT